MNVLCESTDCSFVKWNIFSGWICGKNYIKVDNKRKCKSYEKGKERNWMQPAG